MGAAKSIPVVGELITAADVGSKVLIGVAVAPFSDEHSEKFLNAAKNSFIDYGERSLLAATVSTPLYLLLDNNPERLTTHWNSVGISCIEVVDGIPVVGHIKGTVHYATGDKEHGDQCMKAASRSAVCALVTAATAGYGVVVVAGLTVAAGVTTDVVITTIDSAVHEEFRPNGQVAALYEAIKSGDPVAYFDAARGIAFECTLAYVAATQAEQIAQKQNSTRLYRVMDNNSAAKTVAEQKIPRAYAAGRGPLGETWVSESVEHSKIYMPKQQAKMKSNVDFKTVEVKVDKGFYKTMKANDCVSQEFASNLKGSKNVINIEHLANHPSGKVNVGIKNAKLKQLNEHVTSAKKIDPKTWRYKNGATKAISRYGAEATVLATSELVRSTAPVDNYNEFDDF